MRMLESKFHEVNTKGRAAFVAYLTAGDPSLASTVRLVEECEKNGADVIELGVPFSDPIADGPVNQAAALRGLESGTTLGGIFHAVREIRTKSAIPIVLFTYYNPVLAYGLEAFATDAKSSGVDGALVLDLPPEEAGEYQRLMDACGLATIFLISPITPQDRIELIARKATGFIYYVSQMGVTGERTAVASSLADNISRIRSHTTTPIAAGFGISTPDQVREVASLANGVIVGSAIVSRIGELGSQPGFERLIGNYIRSLTEPLREIGHG